ncbi:hypothetical protein AHS86_24540 [Salmonella enterica subsp. enterica]|nr:hypothetical protein [Salmonella enterica subsp. enterica]EBQ8979247.1 hypothetical protein [Salmonella enterica subsp. enterica serovar Albany]EBW6452246.1 hypothetical protein [Salmonella enterica subsp. enterica serovar Oranienburg]ECH9152631.1 hypothetical protein [Salmonella enterica subsp. enterica]
MVKYCYLPLLLTFIPSHYCIRQMADTEKEQGVKMLRAFFQGKSFQLMLFCAIGGLWFAVWFMTDWLHDYY